MAVPRSVSIGACTGFVLALIAAAAPAAQAANTWEGVWSSDFGRMTMGAGGSGSYEGFNPGTISGPAVGDVNEGTWHRNAQDPQTDTDNGTYRFVLSSGGRSFSGTWAYDGGGCGTACGWNGTCVAGACLDNGVDDGGGGGGGKCGTRSGGGRCLVVDFGFKLERGVPDKPGPMDLPDSLVTIQGAGDAEVDNGTGRLRGNGYVTLFTEHLSTALQPTDHAIILAISGPAGYERDGARKRVTFGGVVDTSSDDPSCAPGGPFEGKLATRKDDAALRLSFKGSGRCISGKPLVWGTESLKRAFIKPRRGGRR